MQHFLSFWASYSITWPRCKRSFVSNNWCLVWTGSAFPKSFLSCKQSDAERKDFVDIPEQGYSWFYTSLRHFCFFRRRDSLSQLRVERRWFELVSKGDLVITLLWLHDSVIFGACHSSNHSNSPRRGCSNQNEA